MLKEFWSSEKRASPISLSFKRNLFCCYNYLIATCCSGTLYFSPVPYPATLPSDFFHSASSRYGDSNNHDHICDITIVLFLLPEACTTGGKSPLVFHRAPSPPVLHNYSLPSSPSLLFLFFQMLSHSSLLTLLSTDLLLEATMGWHFQWETLDAIQPSGFSI